MSFSAEEKTKLQDYLQGKFGNSMIAIKDRAKTDDSVEVLIGGVFIGLIYKDDEDKNDISYDFNMAILDMDLNGA